MSNFHEATRRAERALRVTEHRMATELLLPGRMDETSVLFRDPYTLREYVDWAESVGFEHFNSVRDHMNLLDLDQRWTPKVVRPMGWDVQFEFLRRPGASWRIEAMCVIPGSGYAPLHEAHLNEHGDASVVHVSYKPDDYNAALEVLADQLDFNAEYRNTYGQFSYWNFGAWYVKPRMAFRDHVPTEVQTHVTT